MQGRACALRAWFARSPCPPASGTPLPTCFASLRSPRVQRSPCIAHARSHPPRPLGIDVNKRRRCVRAYLTRIASSPSQVRTPPPRSGCEDIAQRAGISGRNHLLLRTTSTHLQPQVRHLASLVVRPLTATSDRFGHGQRAAPTHLRPHRSRCASAS